MSQVLPTARPHEVVRIVPSPFPDRPSPETELVDRHWRAVRAYLRVLGADQATADDLAQEVFVDAIRKGLTDRGLPTRAWLMRAARFAWSHECRRGQRRPWPWSRAQGGDSSIEEAVWARGEDAFDGHREALRQCLGRLTDRVQAALAMVYRDRAGRGAVAATLGIAPGGVKSMLRRARKSLKDCIERAVGPLGGRREEDEE